MKFIWAFLETLLGVSITVGVILIIVVAETTQIIKPQYATQFSAYFVVSVCLAAFIAIGISLAICGIRRVSS